MNGYYTSFGYLGLVGARWLLFATDEDYYDYVEEEENHV